MSVKILGGLAKSRSLLVPKADITRPTSVLLKRRIFDAHQDLSRRGFYDLCAGSGAMGFEAWSRGASQTTFVESTKEASRILKKNLTGFQQDFSEEVKIRPLGLEVATIQKFLPRATFEESDILFFDPPYEDHHLYKFLLKDCKERVLKPTLWIESDRQKGVDLDFLEESLGEAQKVYRQGTAFLAVFRFC